MCILLFIYIKNIEVIRIIFAVLTILILKKFLGVSMCSTEKLKFAA